ncbi:fumarylacetoacetate hydrolase family protein [Ottowia thiooxydans]|uniref:fumarylacetoacetate hydrolase family protein n=1 Tax=Ottowia thiooxydans TaxID=219182 RepID=UPI0003F8FE4F|nr:fumarylacetoacetate hydrolase family protein [Ottowia thiooxydans]
MSATNTWLPQGTVYGTLLNFRRELDLWAPKMNEAPYKAPPKAPVLYIKTANTFAPCDSVVAVTGEVDVGATLGLVIADAGNQAASGSWNSVAGCVLMNDLSIPHASYYRPPLRFRNLDGFLVCGSAERSIVDMGDPSALTLEVRINDQLVQRVDLSTLVRNAATLLKDVSAFMTLQPGDVLMLGTDCLEGGTRPRAKAGDRIEITAPGFAPLAHTLTAEEA